MRVAMALVLAVAAASYAGWVLGLVPGYANVAVLAAGVVVLAVGTAVEVTRGPLPLHACAPARLRAERVVDVLLVLLFVEVGWSAVWRGPGGVRVADLVLVALALLALGSAAAIRNRYAILLALGAGLVVAGALASTSASGQIGGDATVVLRVLFVMILAPLVLMIVVTTERRLVLAFAGLVASAAVASAVALGEKTANLWLLPFSDSFGGARTYGLSEHPVILGLTAATALPVAAALSLVARGGPRAAWAVTAPLVVVGLILSASRGPLLGALAAIVLLFAVARREGRRLARAAVPIGLVALVAAVVFSQSLARLFDDASARSAGVRVGAYRAAVEKIAEQPLVGEGAYLAKGAEGLNPDNSLLQVVRVQAGEFDDIASHNVFLDAWRSLGILGVAGLVLAYATAVVAGLRLVANASGRTRLYGAALLASLLAVLTGQLFASTVFERQGWLVVALLVALAANCRHPQWREEPRAGERAPPLRARALGPGTAAGALAVLIAVSVGFAVSALGTTRYPASVLIGFPDLADRSLNAAVADVRSRAALTPAILADAADRLHRDVESDALAERLSVSGIDGLGAVRITFVASDRDEAEEVADALAAEFVEAQRSALYAELNARQEAIEEKLRRRVVLGRSLENSGDLWADWRRIESALDRMDAEGLFTVLPTVQRPSPLSPDAVRNALVVFALGLLVALGLPAVLGLGADRVRVEPRRRETGGD